MLSVSNLGQKRPSVHNTIITSFKINQENFVIFQPIKAENLLVQSAFKFIVCAHARVPAPATGNQDMTDRFY